MEASSTALGKRRSQEPARFFPDDDAAQRGVAHSTKKPKDGGPAGSVKKTAAVESTVPVNRFLGQILYALCKIQAGKEQLRREHTALQPSDGNARAPLPPLEPKDGKCVLDRAWEAWSHSVHAVSQLPSTFVSCSGQPGRRYCMRAH